MNRLFCLAALLAGATSVSAVTFTVSTTQDFGSGSLRQAIRDANLIDSDDPHRIQFAIPGAGVRTIFLGSPLPAVERPVIIDGYSQPGSKPNTSDSASDAVPLIELTNAGPPIPVGLDIKANNSTVAGLIIGRFGTGVRVRGAENTVRGNFIGTTSNGTAQQPNTTGVLLDGANRTLIGGPTAAACNVISGNMGAGIRVIGSSSDSRIQGNLIGTEPDALERLPNVTGIEITSGQHVVGPLLEEQTGANVIAYNTQGAVRVTGDTTNVFISRNRIFDNADPAIDLGDERYTMNDDDDSDTGPNGLQNFPVIQTATRHGGEIGVTGFLRSTPNAAFRVEFFGYTRFGGGAEVFLGSAVLATDAGSIARFDLDVPADANVRYVTATATNAAGGTSELSASVEVIPAARVQNLSTRLRVETGEQVLIGGFIISGDAPKRVVLRAIGPSLRSSELQDVLEDPTIELYSGETSLAENDNWREGDAAEITATGLAPKHDAESAIVRTLAPGGYTALVRGKNNSTGVGLVELYDIDPDNSRLANISSRGYVSTGDRVMIAGVIVGANFLGTGTSKVVVRALGPALEARGIADVLQDPDVRLFDSGGNQIAANDSWKDDQQKELEELELAPTDDDEAAIVATLPPGQYTAVVRGRDDTRGVGLVEVYSVR